MDNYLKIKEYLNDCIEDDKLSHAYIFYGPDENAKREIAVWFSDKILSSRQAWHPDLLLIKPEADEELSIKLIRQIKSFLILRPYSSEHKMVIIETAERLNTFAQNALLKIFEEAPNYAIIILSIKTLDSLLQTIVSRAVKLPFWRTQFEAPTLDENLSNTFKALLEPQFLDKYRYIEKINSQKTPEFFGAWLNFLRKKFKENPTKELTNILFKSQNIYFKLNETNINPKFAYDELILSIWKI